MNNNEWLVVYEEDGRLYVDYFNSYKDALGFAEDLKHEDGIQSVIAAVENRIY